MNIDRQLQLRLQNWGALAHTPRLCSLDLSILWPTLKPYCTDQVILDVGTAHGTFWVDAGSFPIKHVVALELKSNLQPDPRLNTKWVTYVRGGVASVRHLELRPTVAVFGNVLHLWTYAELRSILFALPETVNTLVIIKNEGSSLSFVQQSVYARPPRDVNLSANPFCFGFDTLTWVEGSSVNAHIAVSRTALTKWRATAANPATAQVEPCPECSDLNIEFNSGSLFAEARCMYCGYSIELKNPPEGYSAKQHWNEKIIKGYRQQEL